MGLQKSINEETVGDLPLLKPICVEPSVTVREAIQMMRDRKLGCVIVKDENRKPQGMMSERHLIKLLPNGQAFLDDPVEKHMSELWASVGESESIAMVIHKMQYHGIRFLCVVDDQGKVVGQTGQKGVMRYIAEHFPHQVKVQMMESKLYMDQREGA
jgi:predicted transcriptional regulator